MNIQSNEPSEQRESQDTENTIAAFTIAVEQSEFESYTDFVANVVVDALVKVQDRMDWGLNYEIERDEDGKLHIELAYWADGYRRKHWFSGLRLRDNARDEYASIGSPDNDDEASAEMLNADADWYNWQVRNPTNDEGRTHAAMSEYIIGYLSHRVFGKSDEASVASTARIVEIESDVFDFDLFEASDVKKVWKRWQAENPQAVMADEGNVVTFVGLEEVDVAETIKAFDAAMEEGEYEDEDALVIAVVDTALEQVSRSNWNWDCEIISERAAGWKLHIELNYIPTDDGHGNWFSGLRLRDNAREEFASIGSPSNDAEATVVMLNEDADGLNWQVQNPTTDAAGTDAQIRNRIVHNIAETVFGRTDADALASAASMVVIESNVGVFDLFEASQVADIWKQWTADNPA